MYGPLSELHDLPNLVTVGTLMKAFGVHLLVLAGITLLLILAVDAGARRITKKW